MLLLFTIITQSIPQDIRTLLLYKMSDTQYECIDSGCSPSTITFVSNLMDCQIACLSDANCRTVTFDQFSKDCELFPDTPSQYGNMAAQTGVVTMIAIDNRELSARK
jgi:hypothetical protein